MPRHMLNVLIYNTKRTEICVAQMVFGYERTKWKEVEGQTIALYYGLGFF